MSEYMIGPKVYSATLRNQEMEPKQEKKGKKLVIHQKQEHFDFLVKTIGKCEKCGRSNLLTLDHIIPRHILESMGFRFDQMFDKENLRLLCRPCNVLKSNFLDFSTLKTKELLTRYLKDL